MAKKASVTRKPAAKPAVLSYNVTERAAVIAPLMKEAQEKANAAKKARDGAETIITQEIVTMHEVCAVTGQRLSDLTVGMFGNAGKQSTKITGALELTLTAQGFKGSSISSIMSRARKASTFAIADFEKFAKAARDEKGAYVRLTVVNAALEPKPDKDPGTTSQQPETVEAFITRYGMHRIFDACAALLKSAKETTLMAATCESLSKQVKPYVMKKADVK